MITAPYNQPPFTCPPTSMAFANTSAAWKLHFSPPTIVHGRLATLPTAPTPSDYAHYVQSHAQRNNPTSVLAALDRFAATANPLASCSLNPKAELIVDEVLVPFTLSHDPTATNPITMLEPLGVSSLGYSAIWFASALVARFGRARVRYIALETNPESAHAAQQIVKHAGLADVIQVVLGSMQERVDELPRQIDLVLLMKSGEEWQGGLDARYMVETWRLMEAGMLVKGSTVIADNMMEPGAPEYGRWVETHAGFESRRYEMIMREDEDGDEEVDAVEVSVVL